jgi:ribonuclease BN (tRNA processing enzyme)
MRIVMAAVAGLALLPALQQPGAQTKGRTQVVMLGTGTPRPEPTRSGPATAIVVNDAAYLVDAGPGIVRRAEAAFEKGVAALAPDRLTTAFITHLHSDHTVGLPDLIFTTWVQGRRVPLKLYGPEGLAAMRNHIMAAWQADIDIRTSGMEQRKPTVVEAHEVKPGVVYKDENVTATAFRNAHGELKETFGYRFQTADRSIVISGDTNPSAALIEQCQKCDVLIHEVYADAYRPADVPNWLEYRSKYHTTTTQLAEIANKTQPGLLVMYHRGIGPRGREISDEQYLSEVRRTYSGKVVVGNDLDIY